MARIVTDVPERSRTGRKGSHYDQFLDGQLWELTAKDSVSGKTSAIAMRTAIANLCRQREVKLSTLAVRHGKLYVQKEA